MKKHDPSLIQANSERLKNLLPPNAFDDAPMMTKPKRRVEDRTDFRGNIKFHQPNLMAGYRTEQLLQELEELAQTASEWMSIMDEAGLKVVRDE